MGAPVPLAVLFALAPPGSTLSGADADANERFEVGARFRDFAGCGEPFTTAGLSVDLVLRSAGLAAALCFSK